MLTTIGGGNTHSMTDDLTDADRDAQIVAQYERHQGVYDAIEDKLTRIREVIETGPREVAETMLFLADTYALISAQTSVDAHELGFVRVVHAESMAEVREVLEETRANEGSTAIMYYNNKADFIEYNIKYVDYGHHLDLFRNGKIDELHRRKLDEVKGVQMNKAGFSLAMCGVTEKMCVDANVARFFGLDPDNVDDVPSTVVVDRWDQFCKDLRRRAPTLLDDYDVSPYIWQWVTFDCQREVGVESHDPWFLTVDGATDGDVLGPTGAQL